MFGDNWAGRHCRAPKRKQRMDKKEQGKGRALILQLIIADAERR